MDKKILDQFSTCGGPKRDGIFPEKVVLFHGKEKTVPCRITHVEKVPGAGNIKKIKGIISGGGGTVITVENYNDTTGEGKATISI